MATKDETSAAFERLDTALAALFDNGRLGLAESEIVSALQAGVVAVSRDFLANASRGDRSDAYDAPLAAADAATTQAVVTQPGHVEPLRDKTRIATARLAAVTATATARRSDHAGRSVLLGSLRFETVHPRGVHDAAVMVAPAGVGLAAGGAGGLGRADTGANAGGGEANYYNKLITLFPAEALTLYGTGVAVFGRSTFAALIVCMAILILLRWVANKPREGNAPTDMAAVAVAAISFLLWTTATDPTWLNDIHPMGQAIGEWQKWAAFLGTACVLVAPLFVRPARGGVA